MNSLWRAVSRFSFRLQIAIGGERAKHRLLRKRGVRIGRDCRIFTDSFGSEPYLISIGNRCSVTAGVVFITHDGGCSILRQECENLQDFGPIVIEDNCFIGVNSIIMPHVRIGRDSIVAAGSLVTKSVPPRTVVGGVPARPLMTLEQYTESKLRLEDAQQVPLPGHGQRAYLLERYREFLGDD